jgi:hypothetical protein
LKAVFLFGLAALSVTCIPQSYAGNSQPGSQQANGLEQFLKGYLHGGDIPADDVRYSVAFADLHGDGQQEAIVYISGRSFCGSGGCLTLILAPTGDSWRLLGKMTITNKPIRLLPTTTHDWHDIGVYVRGGGIQTGYEAAVPFNGKRYAGNPSASPARPAHSAAGTVLIAPSNDGQPLYR